MNHRVPKQPQGRRSGFPPPTLLHWPAGEQNKLSHEALAASGVFVVGRAVGCDVELDDPAVSRRHFALHAHAGLLRLVVLPDAADVFINGQKVDDRWLSMSDTIRFGDTEMSVSYPPLGDDPTKDPKKPRRVTGRASREPNPAEVCQAVLSLAERHNGTFARLPRTLLDAELATLLGLGDDRARHRLDDLFRELRGPASLRSGARYAYVAEQLRARP